MIGCLDDHWHVLPTRTLYDAAAKCSADVIATTGGRWEWFTSVTVLSPDGEINRELTRRSRTSGKCRRRRAEGSRDVVRVREVLA
jgi:hypothetical protein